MGPVALIYPPTCDPTAPYLSVPMLTGALRARGVRVLPIDANVEAFDRLLRRAPLEALRDRVLGRLAELEAKPSLGHAEQRLYATLWSARGDAEWAPGAVEGAVADLRDPEAFFDLARYERATRTIEAALRAVSAAYAPLELTFTAYRTPFSLLTPEEIERDAGPDRDPFGDYARELGARLRAEGVRTVGLSVVFPGQVQPAFSLAFALREALGPGAHLTVGGPAITQLLLRIKDDPAALARALGPFDSAICYEGETPLFKLVEALEAGRSPVGIPNVIVKGHALCAGGTLEDLRALPPPDFDGLPLDKYLSPALVLP
ncbi:MAG TPA: B12-binding domain-containing radical SAM protein, partial [Polyangiaceae bacterium]|nr:B12-binding domain-containing radical SAM protein [Polyangiaceae bacterium]